MALKQKVLEKKASEELFSLLGEQEHLRDALVLPIGKVYIQNQINKIKKVLKKRGYSFRR